MQLLMFNLSSVARASTNPIPSSSISAIALFVCGSTLEDWKCWFLGDFLDGFQRFGTELLKKANLLSLSVSLSHTHTEKVKALFFFPRTSESLSAENLNSQISTTQNRYILFLGRLLEIAWAEGAKRWCGCGCSASRDLPVPNARKFLILFSPLLFIICIFVFCLLTEGDMCFIGETQLIQSSEFREGGGVSTTGPLSYLDFCQNSTMISSFIW